MDVETPMHSHETLRSNTARTPVLLAATIAVAAAIAASAWIDAHAQATSGATVAGPARVVDGDTLEVRGTRVRLHGIDAPETKQQCRAGGRLWACGREATRALARYIGSRTVSCEERDRDRYGRVVAVCHSGGKDLNAWMATQGWAFAYRRYSTDYTRQETSARTAKRGVWRGEAVAPWDWRRGTRLANEKRTTQRATSQARTQPPRGCAIKGNISKSGTRIYHVPDGRYYDATQINTAKGERWFCSEAEAQGAGWRRSRQ